MFEWIATMVQRYKDYVWDPINGWVRESIGPSQEIIARLDTLEREMKRMSVELEHLKESVALVHKAVDEAVLEIKDLAAQLADVANKPNPEAAEFEAIAVDLKSAAEKLHGAVFPPSSHVELTP